jgi:hypothetical protein
MTAGAKKRPDGKSGRKQEPAAVDPRAPIVPDEAALSAALTGVRDALRKLTPPPEPHRIDLVHGLMHIVFADGMPCGVGQEAIRRIESEFVDRNELRVTEAFEVEELLRDLEIPDLFQRCNVLRDVVGQIYSDQNSVSLDALREAGVADRTSFFHRVPSLPPRVIRYLNGQLMFEEAAFSDKSTQRVVQRLGMDPANAAVVAFFTELKTVLLQFGHAPLRVAADRADHRPVLDPALCVSCILIRLSPAGRRGT